MQEQKIRKVVTDMNESNGNLDALINSAAAASGHSRAQLEQMINSDAWRGSSRMMNTAEKHCKEADK